MTQSRTITKPDHILKLIGGRHGASMSKLCEKTGWQSHSVRSAICRLRRKGHVIRLVVSKSAGKENRYKIDKAAQSKS